ncbi:MAG: hypothetical protein Kow0019_05620 [Methanobacteriaceae archaeon]
MATKNKDFTGLGLILGVGIGTALGIIYNNLAIFAGLGAAFGIIIGFIFSMKK